MLGKIFSGRDDMNIKIKNSIGRLKVRQSRLFLSFAQSYIQNIFISISMATRLHPLVELGMMYQQGFRSIGIYDPCRTGNDREDAFAENSPDDLTIPKKHVCIFALRQKELGKTEKH